MSKTSLSLTSSSPTGTAQQPSSTAPKRLHLKACESCSQRKIRCPGPSDENDGPCEKCMRSNRPCHFRQRANRARRKRVEVRVRELEQRIVDLAAKLNDPSEASEESIDTVPDTVLDDVGQVSEAYSTSVESSRDITAWLGATSLDRRLASSAKDGAPT
jgi:hypothetical protein